LSTADALEFKAAGNVPDQLGRSLRLVLHVVDDADAARLHERRLEWEPDFHDRPSWRREGSAPVNVVPLRPASGSTSLDRSWLDDPAMAALEREWDDTGEVAGVRVPAAYRSFVYKTVVALRSARREVTVNSIADSVERWLGPDDASRLRAALEAANG
jgi:hypothetical protein